MKEELLKTKTKTKKTDNKIANRANRYAVRVSDLKAVAQETPEHLQLRKGATLLSNLFKDRTHTKIAFARFKEFAPKPTRAFVWLTVDDEAADSGSNDYHQLVDLPS